MVRILFEKTMRIDHHAYQRATRVAGFGLLLQIAMGILLLVLGLVSHDTTFQFTSLFMLIGVLAWLGLVIIFHQHKLERLEALEEDELAATRAGAGSFFDKAGDETLVAARRLATMHKWLMPAFSIVIALALAGLATLMLRYMGAVRAGTVEFHITDERGWAVAICLAVAAFSFVFSRFVAGMAKQPVWQNLRGGAAYMVGNALVMVAVAAGIICRFFENDSVIQGMAYAIVVFLYLLAGEVVLNFVLNLYRPRIPGEVPRPAFDSKFLSLLATPDSLVRSLNEAVNYQFGFDVTSSWGYQLLLRSFVWLLVLGAAALIFMSMMVVVEPYQQAIKLRGGAIVGNKIYNSGIMWKLPWPIETAIVYDVSTVRQIHLTPKVIKDRDIPIERRVILWTETETPATDGRLDPFIVGSTSLVVNDVEVADAIEKKPEGAVEDISKTEEEIKEEKAAEIVSSFYSLVDAEIVLQYRIQPDNDGLLKYLGFAPDTFARRQSLNELDRSLKLIALSEVSEHLSRLSLDEVLSPGLSSLATTLQDKIQAAFDQRQTGVQVVAVNLPMLRPSGGSAPTFEEFGISQQAKQQSKVVAERDAHTQMTALLGDASLRDEILLGIAEYERLAVSVGRANADAIGKRQEVQATLMKGNGQAAQLLATAEVDRWYDLMMKQKQVTRVQSETPLYRASPEIYRQRETMRVYRRLLPNINKYIIATDPSRVDVDVDLKTINPFVDFVGASPEEENQ